MLYILFAVQMLINLTSCLYFNLSVLATLNIRPSFPLKSRQKWTPNWTNQTKPTWSLKMDSKLVWEVTQLTVQLQVGKVRRHYRTGLGERFVNKHGRCVQCTVCHSWSTNRGGECLTKYVCTCHHSHPYQTNTGGGAAEGEGKKELLLARRTVLYSKCRQLISTCLVIPY